MKFHVTNAYRIIRIANDVQIRSKEKNFSLYIMYDSLQRTDYL